jgi:mono/diheme cytochrome c family protein
MIGVGVVVAVVLGGLILAEEPMSAGTAPDPGGTSLAVVTVPDNLSEQAQIGQRAFAAKCAACHGENASGQNGVAPPLVHKIYEPSHHGDMSFVLAVKNGVRAHHWRFGDMPPVDGLTQSDVMNIVAYVRELQRANGIN